MRRFLSNYFDLLLGLVLVLLFHMHGILHCSVHTLLSKAPPPIHAILHEEDCELFVRIRISVVDVAFLYTVTFLHPYAIKKLHLSELQRM